MSIFNKVIGYTSSNVNLSSVDNTRLFIDQEPHIHEVLVDTETKQLSLSEISINGMPHSHVLGLVNNTTQSTISFGHYHNLNVPNLFFQFINGKSGLFSYDTEDAPISDGATVVNELNCFLKNQIKEAIFGNSIRANQVTLERLERERALNWPNIHPEDYCHICGHENPSWYVDRTVWLFATKTWASETGREGICCPTCFQKLLEKELETTICPDKKVTLEIVVKGARSQLQVE